MVKKTEIIRVKKKKTINKDAYQYVNNEQMIL